MTRIPATTGWGVALALVTALISGFSVFLNGQFVKSFEDPTLLAAVRNGLVGVVLLAVATVGAGTGFRRLGHRDRLGLLVIGVIGGGIPFALFFNGLALSSSPAASVIHKTLFLWVAVLAVPFLGERPGWLQVAALGVLIAGTLFLAPAGSLGTGVGEALIVAATALWAVEVVVARRLLRGSVPAGLAAAARMTIGSLCLFGLVALTGGLGGILAYGPEQWAAIALTGVLLTGYVATWYAALRRAPATVVSSVLVVGAVVTTSLAAWSTGQTPAAPALLGNVLLFAGAALAVAGARAVRLDREPVPVASYSPGA
jgi:drug/metabolite transporter (DMT)-like permease